MSAESIHPAFAEFEDSAELELTKVLALQALLMGEVRSIAHHKGRRTHVRGNPRAHLYGMLHNSAPGIFDHKEIYTGGKDRFFGVRVRRLDYRMWGMGVRISENTITQSRLSDQTRSVYQFRWNERTALGRREISYINPYSDAYILRETGKPMVIEPPDAGGISEVLPLFNEDVEELSDRVRHIAHAALSRAA